MWLHWDGICNWDVGPLCLLFPHTYLCNDELAGLHLRWLQSPSHSDGIVCGITADWIEDHREELLTTAFGPDPEGQIDKLIDYLRNRFRRQFETAK